MCKMKHKPNTRQRWPIVDNAKTGDWTEFLVLAAPIAIMVDLLFCICTRIERMIRAIPDICQFWHTNFGMMIRVLIQGKFDKNKEEDNGL